MRTGSLISASIVAGAGLWLATPVLAGPVTLFSTGTPDGRIATVSRPAGAGTSETETADDFILGQNALVSGATFIGLLPSGAPLSSIGDVEVELYHVFPTDSTNPPSGNVPTRVNSPSDTNFGSSFDFGACNTSNCTATILSPSFTASNSVLNGINDIPNQTTGGEGPVTGEEVLFTLTFSTPFFVGATDHDFFRPEVGLSTGAFYWLSAPKPIVSGTPFTPDLQAWIRNDGVNGIAPDWLRIGTDIVGGATPPTFNMAFSLQGTPVPEPTSLACLAIGIAFWTVSRRQTRGCKRA